MPVVRMNCRGLLCLMVSLAGASDVMAAAPQSYLKLDDDTLHVTAGKPVRMTIQIPGDETWSQANVGQFQVRTFGKVETITPEPTNTSTQLSYTFAEPGYAMVIFAAGASSSRGRSDSVTSTPYCAKLLVRVDPDPSATQVPPATLKNAGMTSKVGLKVEVSPYIDPTTFTPATIAQGADLPVRVYYEGSAQKHVEITAYSPDGSQQTKTTGTKGTARFKVDAVGRWVVRYQHTEGSVVYTGDLVFDAGTVTEGAGK